MKRRLLKIAMFVIGVPAGMVLSGFLIYVYLYYPRQAEPFEIKTENPQKRILIATEGSEFKNLLVKNLCDSLQKSSVYIKGVDVGDLKRIDAKHWDRILVINTFMVWPSKNVHRFVDGALDPEKILLMVTSGGADWQPNSDLRIDAFTSASRREHISDLSRLIVGWIGKKNDQKWEPEDYVLLLRYFPRVDVRRACENISLEQVQYKSAYPNLVNIINQIGYQFLRIEDIESAIEVFRLNVSLFPDHWNVYDSYGEALVRKGDREGAVVNYRKALELNPNSQSAKNMLKKLSKT